VRNGASPNPDRGSKHGDADAPLEGVALSASQEVDLGGYAASRIRSWVK
jgi:hypothetical protein